MQPLKIIAVIVTYNRLNLLKKCLLAVTTQTRQPDEVIVINNGSTDDTLSWLQTQPVTYLTQENKGGAGGFAYGLKAAYKHNADWVWVMDDDTIPDNNALEKLLEPLYQVPEEIDKIGFLASSVLWTDGSLHEMNLTYQLTDERRRNEIAWSSAENWPLIQFGTFVSLLISSKAVAKVGLPIAAYFIWNDDVEYTKRIVNAGMAGLAVEGSMAMHETPVNHMSSVFKDGAGNLWKYQYGMRNELCTKRMHEGELQFWITWLHRMLIMPFRIALNRRDSRCAFTKMIWQTSIAAVTFKPVIERV